MNLNLNTSDNKPWQWLMASPTRMVGLILLVLALVLLLALMVLVSPKSAKKKTGVSIPQASPVVPSPSSIPDPTAKWTILSNTNGFKIKYPPGSQLIPTLPQASSSAFLQITSDRSTLAIEVTDQKKTLKETVDLIRQKNASSSGSIQINKVITKPISILIGGIEGYEWYLESNGLTGITTTFASKLGKNRVIVFDKNNKHNLIFSSLDETGEQLLSALQLQSDLDETTAWKIYTNQKYGFSFKYPPNLEAKDYSYDYDPESFSALVYKTVPKLNKQDLWSPAVNYFVAVIMGPNYDRGGRVGIQRSDLEYAISISELNKIYNTPTTGRKFIKTGVREIDGIKFTQLKIRPVSEVVTEDDKKPNPPLDQFKDELVGIHRNNLIRLSYRAYGLEDEMIVRALFNKILATLKFQKS